MKISFPPQALVQQLSQVTALSVVRYNRQCYIVSNTREASAAFDDGGSYELMCLNLKTGSLEEIPSDAQVEVMQAQLTVNEPVLIPSNAPLRPEDVVLSADERREIREGRKIQAIKLLRERTRLGLKEAKDVVDTEAFKMGR